MENESINASATHHPFATMLVGLVLIFLGCLVGVKVSVDAYLRTIVLRSDIQRSDLQQDALAKDIEARRAEADRVSKEVAASAKGKKDAVKDAVDRALRGLKTEGALRDLETKALDLSLVQAQKYETAFFFFWLFRVSGVFASVVAGIGALVFVRGLAVFYIAKRRAKKAAARTHRGHK